MSSDHESRRGSRHPDQLLRDLGNSRAPVRGAERYQSAGIYNDWRKRNPMFTEPELSRNLALVEKLRALAARHGKTAAELAIAWVLRRPELTSAIVGGRKPAQVEETVGGADWVLAPGDIHEIERLLAAR